MTNFTVSKNSLSAYAEDHACVPKLLLRGKADHGTPACRHGLNPWPMLRRIPLPADNPPKPSHLRRSVSAPMGVGGYVMEVPRALPVGLHGMEMFGLRGDCCPGHSEESAVDESRSGDKRPKGEQVKRKKEKD